MDNSVTNIPPVTMAALLADIHALIAAWTGTADAATAFIKTLDPDAKEIADAVKAFKVKGPLGMSGGAS